MLSQSGETEEVVRLLPSLAEFGVPILAITASRGSTLGRAATVVLELGPIEEACAAGAGPKHKHHGDAALGDALALVTSRMRNFAREDFARFHPGGSLGRKLSKVEHHLQAPGAVPRGPRQQHGTRDAGLGRPAGPANRSGDADRCRRQAGNLHRQRPCEVV